MEPTTVILLCLHVCFSLQQQIVPGHLRDVCDAVRNQELLDRAMPQIRQLIQRTQEETSAVHKQDIAALKQENADINQEVAALKEENADINQEVAALKRELAELSTGDKGTVYVRWGRKDCPGDNVTELVYSGYAGGSHYTHSGAAAEYVCLPPDPTWGPHKNIRSYAPALMYGAEYEDPMLFGVPDKNQDVPCAVCRSPAHSTSIMIPARTQCYSDWHEAYHGILSAGYYSHTAASQYVCVDEHPQTLTGGGSTNYDGKLFYQVRTRCGSLQCPPYENDKGLACVVCLK